AQFVGACYLLWLAWQHFRGEEEGEEQDLTRHANFWQTLVMVEMTDLVFSFDSIAASVAVSRKPWVIILGGILGITLMRYMASLFLRWLDEFSRLEDAAFAIIALVGGCMLFEVFFPQIEIPEWGVMIAVIPLFAWGFSRRMGSPLEEEERQEGSVPSLSVLCTVGANELKQEEGISSFGAEPEATPELQPD
ncbi:MAG: DUF475 domain-containing protein, partial [Cyanobacteriota bacterium]